MRSQASPTFTFDVSEFGYCVAIWFKNALVKFTSLKLFTVVYRVYTEGTHIFEALKTDSSLILYVPLRFITERANICQISIKFKRITQTIEA